MLPVFENPACTEGHEGFNHLNSMKGNVEKADMSYILRDHDSAKLEKKKETFRKIAAYLNDKYGADTVTVTITDSYRNMKEQILNHMYIVDAAKEAIEKAGVKVISGLGARRYRRCAPVLYGIALPQFGCRQPQRSWQIRVCLRAGDGNEHQSFDQYRFADLRNSRQIKVHPQKARFCRAF